MATPTIFLVNPASANGSTGRRWPELARRAAAAGLEGDTLLSERPGHLSELAREAALGGARLLVVVGGDGSVYEVANGLVGVADAAGDRGRPARHGLGLRPHVRDPARRRAGGGDRARGRDARRSTLGRVSYRAWDGSETTGVFANVGERRDERGDRQARERDDEGARREGVVPVGDVRRLLALAGGRGRDRRRRRAAHRSHVRRRRRERPLLRRRDADLPRGEARRRAPRRPHDRRRDEARPRADDARRSIAGRTSRTRRRSSSGARPSR